MIDGINNKVDDVFDSDDLQGVPSRVVRLLKFGLTFWIGLWPLALGVWAVIIVTTAVFGTGWVHGGNSRPEPVEFDPDTLEARPYVRPAAVAQVTPAAAPPVAAPAPQPGQ